MRQFKKIVAVASMLLPVGALFYAACLLVVMWRNVGRTDSPAFTTQNFQDSWLPALIITCVVAFAAWGSYMYTKSGEA
jgi:hypothetical protein